MKEEWILAIEQIASDYKSLAASLPASQKLLASVPEGQTKNNFPTPPSPSRQISAGTGEGIPVRQESQLYSFAHTNELDGGASGRRRRQRASSQQPESACTVS